MSYELYYNGEDVFPKLKIQTYDESDKFFVVNTFDDELYFNTHTDKEDVDKTRYAVTRDFDEKIVAYGEINDSLRKALKEVHGKEVGEVSEKDKQPIL